MDKKIRIIIADDHKVVRSGLRALFRTSTDFAIVGEAGDGLQTVLLVEKKKPDVALIDISMPKLNGIDATRTIKVKSPTTKVLILTIHENEGYVDEIIRVGANGYVLKNAEKKELFTAVRTVAAGGEFFSPSISKLMIEGFIKRVREKGEGVPSAGEKLTKRETEILCYIAQGLTGRQIANELSISIRTVNTHRSNIMQKLNIHTTAGLVRYAIHAGLVDSQP